MQNNLITPLLKTWSVNPPAHRIIQFVNYLRNEGFKISPASTILLIKALENYGIDDASFVKHICQNIVCKNQQQWQQFDELYKYFFYNKKKGTSKITPPNKGGIKKNPSNKHTSPSINQWDKENKNFKTQSAPSLEQQIDDMLTNYSASSSGSSISRQRRNGDLTRLFHDELMRLFSSMSQKLYKQLKIFPTHLFEVNGNESIDYPRTYQNSFKTGGEIVEIKQKKQNLRCPNLLVFIDTSPSMNQTALTCITAVWYLCQRFKNAKVYLFDTELFSIEIAVKKPNFIHCLEHIKLSINGWGSGTTLVDCLETYQQKYYRKNDSRAYCLFFSDGLDTGDKKKLYNKIKILKRQNKKLIWINPNKSVINAKPQTKHLKYIFPLINQYIVTHNLHNLHKLIK